MFLENANCQSVYNTRVGNCVIRISAAEAASDFPALLDHVRVGDEFVIEHDARLAAVLRCVASTASLDRGFAAIVQEAPDEGWEGIPCGLANNLDPYIYIR